MTLLRKAALVAAITLTFGLSSAGAQSTHANAHANAHATVKTHDEGTTVDTHADMDATREVASTAPTGKGAMHGKAVREVARHHGKAKHGSYAKTRRHYDPDRHGIDVAPVNIVTLTPSGEVAAVARTTADALAGTGMATTASAVRSFEALDLDHNGWLSGTEVATVLTAEANYRLADLNGDGQLSRAEFDAWIASH